MKSAAVALLLLFAAPGVAAAQADGPAPEGEAMAAEEPHDEIIVEGEVPKERRRVCETRTDTGSIIPKRVCRTVAQIEEEERTARESLEIIRRDRDTRGFVQMSSEQGT